MTGLIHFSADAASNDVAAPPILWVEGQPAGTVNNSAREVMAALARHRDDNAGGLVANRGGGDAYAVATNQIFDATSFNTAHTVAFNVLAENQGPATLSLDGQPALSLRRLGNLDLGPRDLRPGIVYRVVRSTTAAVYLILSPGFDECGTVSAFASPDVPPGWLPCDGRSLSRTSYAALFLRIGGFYGTDNDTTFKIPDLRGRTVFGVDGGAGRLTDAGGLAGNLAAAGGSASVTLTEAQLASHGHGGSTNGAGAHDHGGSVNSAGQHNHTGATGAAGGHSHAASSDQQGDHAHTGSTNSSGNHTHQQGYYVGTAGSGGTNRVVGDLQPSGVENAIGVSHGGGDHSHTLSTNTTGAHSHGITVTGVGDHAHSIQADGQHAHGINAVGDHAHTLAISATGGGQGHSNIPPGLVLTYAIKV